MRGRPASPADSQGLRSRPAPYAGSQGAASVDDDEASSPAGCPARCAFSSTVSVALVEPAAA
eukprot:1646803-Heterocapsa_arctica.AAC.1